MAPADVLSSSLTQFCLPCSCFWDVYWKRKEKSDILHYRRESLLHRLNCWIRKTNGGAEKTWRKRPVKRSSSWRCHRWDGFCWALDGPRAPSPPVRPPRSQAPCLLFDLIKGKRAHQFHWRCREMTAHKLKESSSAGGGGGQRSSLTLNTILCAM